MGWFKKDVSQSFHLRLAQMRHSVMESFSSLHNDIRLQKQWITYLNNIHNTLKNTHDQHRELTAKDLTDLKKWINHLNSAAVNQEKAMNKLQKSINDAMVVYNKNFMELYSHIKDTSKREKKLKDLILKELKSTINTKHKATHERLEKLSQKIKTAPKPSLSIDKHLSNPEQKLLNQLLSETNPVAYSHIAAQTGNSINTVRVIMNSLKKRDLVEENILPSGVKLFSAKNKEKIKKLYNIKHM